MSFHLEQFSLLIQYPAMPPTDTNCAIFAMHITNLGSVFPPSGVPNRVHPPKERTLASTRKLDPGAVGRRAAVGAMAGRGLGFQYMTTSPIKDGSQEFCAARGHSHMAPAPRGKRVAKVQQIPDNHTMLNHTTLLFAPNLPGIKWNITNFALIMAQKALIITQFLSSFLHLILLFISFCQPESI